MLMQPAWCLFCESAFGATDADSWKLKEPELSSIYLSVPGRETTQLGEHKYTYKKITVCVGWEQWLKVPEYSALIVFIQAFCLLIQLYRWQKGHN